MSFSIVKHFQSEVRDKSEVVNIFSSSNEVVGRNSLEPRDSG